MQAILAGSHQAVVEAVSTRVGREVAEGYVDKDAEQVSKCCGEFFGFGIHERGIMPGSLLNIFN